MNLALLERLFQLYGATAPDRDVMPMTIGWLGNNSVATLPTLLDLLHKQQLGEHRVEAGDTVVLAAVGAGMNINALVYQF
jgi:3-oxoacyl-[acyl-carrier-protein] synthase-3